MKKGIFITLEGPDGCGKSTQASLLADLLLHMGYDVVLTHEPGGTKIGQQIREVLLDPLKNEEMSDTVETLLYAADRAQHVDQVIRPMLEAGKVVICVRFVDSSLAYQGFGLQRDLTVIKAVNEIATGGIRPDLTICLDADVEVGLERAVRKSQGKGDRIERRGISFHGRVREGFLFLSRQEPDRIKIICEDGRGVKEIHREVAKLVLERISQGGEGHEAGRCCSPGSGRQQAD